MRRVNGFKSWKTSGHFCDTPSNGRYGIYFYLHQPVLADCKRKQQRICNANYTSSSEGWKILSGQSLNTTRDSCFTKYFLHTFRFRRSVCRLCRPLNSVNSVSSFSRVQPRFISQLTSKTADAFSRRRQFMSTTHYLHPIS